MPLFTGVRMKEDGVLKYNDPVLVDCPAAPLSPDAQALLELLETAADEDIDVGG